jgi:serine/threonine protein phosphatase PrpC
MNIQILMNDIGNGSSQMDVYQAGCTANVCLITPNYVYVANAGDSRSICSINGKLEELSKDHKPEDAIEFERIKNAGGEVKLGRVNGNLNLSRALGDLNFKFDKTLKP